VIWIGQKILWNFEAKCLEKAMQIVPELQTCKEKTDIYPSQLLMLRQHPSSSNLAVSNLFICMR